MIQKRAFSDYDPTVISLIAANILTIAIALYERWSLGEVLVIYWFQNIIIGFFTVLRILKSNFELTGKQPGQSVKSGKIAMAVFFTLHYGFFHFGYYEFIKWFFRGINFKFCFIAVALFFANHLYSYMHYRSGSIKTAEGLKKMIFMPYRRIVPMHVTIIAGVFIMVLFGLAGGRSAQEMGEQAVMVFFLILKTVADVKMHIDEHSDGPLQMQGR